MEDCFMKRSPKFHSKCALIFFALTLLASIAGAFWNQMLFLFALVSLLLTVAAYCTGLSVFSQEATKSDEILYKAEKLAKQFTPAMLRATLNYVAEQAAKAKEITDNIQSLIDCARENSDQNYIVYDAKTFELYGPSCSFLNDGKFTCVPTRSLLSDGMQNRLIDEHIKRHKDLETHTMVLATALSIASTSTIETEFDEDMEVDITPILQALESEEPSIIVRRVDSNEVRYDTEATTPLADNKENPNNDNQRAVL
jgi:sensor histidine kinase regulating citrate/malate metabolism